MSISKQDYWTFAFKSNFTQPGDWRFSDPIYLCPIINGVGTVEEPALVMDPPNITTSISNETKTKITIKADGRIKKLIAIPYGGHNYGIDINTAYLCITAGTDPVVQSNQLKINPTKLISKKDLYQTSLNPGERMKLSAKNYSGSWVAQGVAMIKQEIATAGPGKHASSFDALITQYLNDPTLYSLRGGEPNNPAIYMFMRYFADRFGEDKLDSVSSEYDLVNIAGVGDFDVLLRDWLTAVIIDNLNYISDDQEFNSKYAYKTIDLSTYDLSQASLGYLLFYEDTGAFIYLTDLQSYNRIDISFSGTCNLNLRLIMIPIEGETFSSH